MARKNRYLNIDPYWFLETTVHQEGNNIFNLAYRLCQNREEAKEIAQAAFLKTLENYRSFESRFPIYIFLCRTTFDIWKNRTRRRRRYQAQTRHSSNLIGSGAVADDQTISLNELSEKEQLQVIRKGLAGLPAFDNFIIVLRNVEGKSYLEIACILKCRYLTVKSRLTQAKKRLHANILPDLKNPTIIPQDCHKNSELFSAQLDGLLLQGIEKNLQKHREDCRECRKIFQEMETIQKLLAGVDPAEPPNDFEAGVLKTAKERIARKSTLRYRLRYVPYDLVSATLVLILLIVFYPKPTPRNGLVTTPQVSSKNVLTPMKKSIIAEKALRLEEKYFRSDPPPHTVIRNEQEWANIWRFVNAGRNISTFLPEVDFVNKMVVGIISQDDKSEYTITKTEESKDEVIIICKGTSLTHTNPPFLPLYQFQIVDAKPTVTFKMIRE